MNDSQHKCHSAHKKKNCHNAGCRILFIAMLSVVMLSVAMLGVAMLGVAMLIDVILSVVTPDGLVWNRM